MATVTGARGTGNVSASQRKIDMAEKIFLLEPEASPLTVLTKMLNKKKAINPEFSWLEDDNEPRFDAINNGAGYNTSATSIVVDNGAYFAQHYLVRNTRTGEVFRVTAVSTNTLTVVRGVGNGGTGVAMNDNDELLVIGVAQPEGDTSRPARSSNPTKVLNYTEIFRTPVDATGTWLSSDNQTTQHDWDYQLGKAAVEHKKDIEYAFWLGKPSEDLTGSQPRRTTGGVLHFATQNQTDAGGTLTETEFFGAVRPIYRYSSDRRVAFCSMLAVDVLNQFPRGKLQTVQSDNDTTYGLAVTKFISPHGTLRLITHRLFEGSVLSGYIVILDMDQVRYRFLGGGVGGSRDSALERNIQAPDYDGRKDEWKGEVGLEIAQSKAHGAITNVTG